MKTGHRTTLKAGKINYKVLRRINPEAARLAVIEYLSTNKGNISEAARVFGIQRTVVYDILKKKEEGDLRDRSRALLHCPYKTPTKIEDKVVEDKTRPADIVHKSKGTLSVFLKFKLLLRILYYLFSPPFIRYRIVKLINFSNHLIYFISSSNSGINCIVG